MPVFGSIEDLQGLVRERVEETRSLEFKRELPVSGKNSDLALDIAAIANSGGGTIIYGVEEDKARRASALRPIALTGAPERIALVARTAIDEPVHLTEIRSILDEHAGVGMGYIVAVIPDSLRRPHFVSGKPVGRTAAGNCALSRREVGQLFASSEGFVHEFQLVTTPPARVLARLQTGESSGAGMGSPVWIVLENTGGADAANVTWEWTAVDGRIPGHRALGDDQPLEILPAGSAFKYSLSLAWQTPLTPILVKWQDLHGTPCELLCPICFD